MGKFSWGHVGAGLKVGWIVPLAALLVTLTIVFVKDPNRFDLGLIGLHYQAKPQRDEGSKSEPESALSVAIRQRKADY